MDSEELHLTCDCSSAEHTLRFVYFPQEANVYVTAHLRRGTFVERLKTAFKFVFGRVSCGFGDYDEFIMRPEDTAKLAEFLATYEDSVAVESTRKYSVASFVYERWEARVKKMLARKG